MGSLPLVSTIVPTYNRAGLVVEAVHSVLNQSYQRWEIIVADDGSTDETESRIKSINHPSIRHLALPHSGHPSVTRNRALAEAEGSLVALLDDDDWWEPDKLRRQVECMERNSGAGFIYTDGRLLGSDGTESRTALKVHQKRRGDIFNALLKGCFIHPSTLMVRKELLDQVGWFDETLPIVEDYELVLRLAHAAKAEFVNSPLVRVRRHGEGISQLRELTTYELMLVVLGRLPQQFDLTLAQRLLLRRALARTHAQLSLWSHRKGDISASRLHLYRALKSNPLQRLAWRSLLLGKKGEPDS